MDEKLPTSQEETHKYALTGVGARLRAAREALHLSEKDVAARLYLNIQVIYNMEQEQFTGTPATFMRGYLRSYARLLQLNENELTEALNRLSVILPNSAIRSQPITSIKRSDSHHQHTLDRYLRWSSYGIISVLFVLVIVWWSSHPRFSELDNPAKQITQTTPTPVTSIDTATVSSTPITATANNSSNVSIPPLLARPKKSAVVNSHKEENDDSSVKTAETHKPTKTTHHLDIIDEEDNEKYIDQNNIY